jgi:hypothetical protein
MFRYPAKVLPVSSRTGFGSGQPSAGDIGFLRDGPLHTHHTSHLLLRYRPIPIKGLHLAAATGRGQRLHRHLSRQLLYTQHDFSERFYSTDNIYLLFC